MRRDVVRGRVRVAGGEGAALGVPDASERVVHARGHESRPRLWWFTWTLHTTGKERWSQGKHWPRLLHWGERPQTPPWRDMGYSAGKATLTCRLVPGAPHEDNSWRTNGIQEADQEQIQRWKQDNQRLSTYHYHRDNLLWSQDRRSWRLPTPDECDVLLGFPAGYTNVAGVEPYKREQMVGNTMHVMAVQRILTDIPLEGNLQHSAPMPQPGKQMKEEASHIIKPPEPACPPRPDR